MDLNARNITQGLKTRVHDVGKKINAGFYLAHIM